MIKEMFSKLKEEGFSTEGLGFAEAFFIMAKYGIDGPIPGFDNETIAALGDDEGMEKEDVERLEELGWSLAAPGGCDEYMWEHSSAMY